MKLSISTFTHQLDNVPARGEAQWEDMVMGFADVRAGECELATCARGECPHKSGLSWAPAVWPAGKLRRKGGVEFVSALVVDLDHVPTDAALAEQLGRVAHLRHAVHASHSDRPGDRCVRIILPTSRPVPGHEWPRFWRAAIDAFGFPADEKCKDGSRLYYLPSRPRDACHRAIDGSGFLTYASDGHLLDVDGILAAAPLTDDDVDDFDYEPRDIPEFTGAPSQEAFEQAAQVLGAAWPGAGEDRHGAHLALSGALALAGWPAEVIASFAARVADIQQPGNSDIRKRETAARSSVEKARTGERIQGWPSLAEHVGEEACAAVRRLLGFPELVADDPAFADRMRAAAQRVASMPEAAAQVQSASPPIPPVTESAAEAH